MVHPPLENLSMQKFSHHSVVSAPVLIPDLEIVHPRRSTNRPSRHSSFSTVQPIVQPWRCPPPNPLVPNCNHLYSAVTWIWSPLSIAPIWNPSASLMYTKIRQRQIPMTSLPLSSWWWQTSRTACWTRTVTSLSTWPTMSTSRRLLPTLSSSRLWGGSQKFWAPRNYSRLRSSVGVLPRNPTPRTGLWSSSWRLWQSIFCPTT